MAAPAGLSAPGMFPDDKIEAVAPPTLKAAGLESSHEVEKVAAAGHPRLRTVQGPLWC